MPLKFAPTKIFAFVISMVTVCARTGTAASKVMPASKITAASFRPKVRDCKRENRLDCAVGFVLVLFILWFRADRSCCLVGSDQNHSSVAKFINDTASCHRAIRNQDRKSTRLN